jgi:hypothetical protein
MATRTEFNASNMTARRYLESDNTLSRVLMTFSDESGNQHIVRIPLGAFNAQVDRFVEERLREAISRFGGATLELHTSLREAQSQLTRSVSSAISSVLAGMGEQITQASEDYLGQIRSGLGISERDLRTFAQPAAEESAVATAAQ